MIFKRDQADIRVEENYDDLCRKVTEEILEFSNTKITYQDQFSIVLSGGSTPKGVYQCMASNAYRDKFKWEKIHFFWSDERWVSHEDQKSNYRMVLETLLTKIKIPSSNIHSIQTMQVTIAESARLYEEAVRIFFKLNKDEIPSFDLILLGIGQDGHTASIFPGNSVSLVKGSLCSTVSQEGIPEDRITLTLPIINHAQMVFFLVSGQEKANIVYKVLENDDGNILPANKVKPLHGNLKWFIDKAAACKWVSSNVRGTPKRIGVAADHGGYQLKEDLIRMLREAAYEVIDFGNQQLNPDDDFPDFVVPLAHAVSRTEVDRGIAICSSGVGACIVANKVKGVRACMIHEKFSARQGVEDDDMNVICLGSRVLNEAQAWELVEIFLSSHFSNVQRHRRRLSKIAALE